MKINLILLASGNSTRFNGNKLLTYYKGKMIYNHIIDKVINLNLNKIICVTQYKEIKENLLNTKIEVIINNNSDLGISNSIKLGINFDKNADAYMFMVCDQPFISTKTLNLVIDNFINTDKGIVCVGYKNNKGNPVIFSKKYINDLLSLKGDIGGREIIKKNLEDLKVVEIYDEIEIFDIDTKEDFEKIKAF